MTRAITLTLPWPPSVNTYWRRVSNKTLISAKGRAYRDMVSQLAMVERWPSFGDARLAVSFECAPPDARKRDLDNLGKAPLDALEHAGVMNDDEQVDLLIYRRMPVTSGGELRVTIQEASDGE